MKLRRIIIAVTIIALCLWLAAKITKNNAVASIEQKSREVLAIYVSNLKSELDKYESLPLVLVRNSLFEQLLNNPADASLLDTANKELEKYNRTTRTLNIYLIDINGLTIASSNWNLQSSFIGEDLSFRPYFHQAIKQDNARYFALGTTSRKRGYFFSAPVKSNTGKVLGVLVVKVDLSSMEAAWRKGSDIVVVTDTNSVIFIGNRAGWLFRSLDPLSESLLAELSDSQQYADIVPTKLNVTEREPLKAGINRLRIAEGPSLNSINYLHQFVNMESAGWVVHILADMSIIDRQVRQSLLITILLLSAVLLSISLILYRHRTKKSRLQMEKNSMLALQSAYGELEQRVTNRTIELSTANSKLQQEVEERKHAEVTLRETQDNLLQAEKLAALGQMAASISHELNQPLSALRVFSDNAQNYLNRNLMHETSANLKLISQLSARMADIIKHLRVFARKTPLKLVDTPLLPIIEETLLIYRSQISSEKITLIYQKPQKEFHVLAEPVRLQQVLLNLISNAIDAMKNCDFKKIELNVIDASTSVLISIRDFGPGIEDDIMKKIFDPFFTTKEIGAGLGLGLSISQTILADFNGKLEVRNHPEKGAVFSVFLNTSRHIEEVDSAQ